MQIFSQKYFSRLKRRSCDIRASAANLSQQNFCEFTMRNFRDTRTNVVRVSYDGCMTVLRKHANTSRLSGKKIKLSDIRTTVVQMKMKISYIRGKVDTLTNVARYSCDSGATVVRYIFKIRLKFANLSHKCLLNETAT